MKNLVLTMAFVSTAISLKAQIHVPSATAGNSQHTTKVMVGPYLAPINYEAQLFVNTRNGSTNSSLTNLLLNYTLSSNTGGGAETTPLSVMRVNRWDPYTSTASDIFDLKPSGMLYLGTNAGSSTLNIAGTLEVLGNRDISITSSGVLGWKANSTVPAYQNFTLRYLGDGTNPAKDLMTFKPDGGINVNGFLAPDVNLAIKDISITTPFLPETKVHIKTWGPQGEEDINGVYGMIVENTGWRTHDYGFEVKSYHGTVFSVGNAGHVLIGIQGKDGGTEAEITKALPNPDLYSLYVARGIRTERIRVDVAASNGWADYVFDEGYQLMPTLELEAYIKAHKHLPGVPSAEEVAEEGIDLAEINKILLEKIEELTLRVLELEKAKL